MKGRLTMTRYKNATVFVNHFLRLQFVYFMMTNLTSAEPIDAKHAFEQFATEHGVRISHYHCDNGQFTDSAFVQACKQSR